MNNGDSSFINRISSKTNQYLSTIALATRFFFILCVTLFILECINLIKIYQVCSTPYYFISNPISNGYKIITSNFFHINILHLLFNMLAFIPLGTRAEKLKFGTVQFFYLIMLFSILVPLMNIALSLVASYTISSFGYYSCGIGFSSIVFALLEIEFYEDRLVSLYGITNIPSKLYPFAILFFTYLLLPSSSFMGHLSGILIGLLFVKGHLSFLLLSPDKYVQIETSERLNKVTALQGFITNLNYGSTSSFYNSTGSGSGIGSSTSSLDNSLSRIKNYFNRTSGGNQLGSISPEQVRQQQREQQQQQQQQDIQQTPQQNNTTIINPPTQQQSIDNIDDDNNNGYQIPMYNSTTTSLQYSPLIDMSKDDSQLNNNSNNK